MIDKWGREIDYLRISVTDKCNLRCIYCMPEKGIQFTKEEVLMTDAEILQLVKYMAKLGIEKVRITGGEPFARRGIIQLISDIKSIRGIKEVCVTTNGILIEDKINELKNAGLDGINISLDTLDSEKYKMLTRGGEMSKVLKSIDEALNVGIKVKLNSVIIKGINEDEVLDLIKLTSNKKIDVRFIELMPIGQANDFKAVTNYEIRELIKLNFKVEETDKEKKNLGPAKYIKIHGFMGKVGFISAMSNCFCSECNRIRLTSEGFLKQCLNFNYGINIKDVMRSGMEEEDILNLIKLNIYNKPSEHSFKQTKSNQDVRYMNQIGG